ncbi:MAG: hypothetical protein K6E93_03895 [Bacteroidales bacterium]|nr:hypothetical protein [Bacteroidales bacterium]
MRKVIVAMAVVAMAAAFTSCSKQCNCYQYVDGNLTNTIEDFEVPSGHKCKDMTMWMQTGEHRTGTECVEE